MAEAKINLVIDGDGAQLVVEVHGQTLITADLGPEQAYALVATGTTVAAAAEVHPVFVAAAAMMEEAVPATKKGKPGKAGKAYDREEIIRMAQAMRAKDVSYGNIARGLNETGHRRAGGAEWTGGAIRTILVRVEG